MSGNRGLWLAADLLEGVLSADGIALRDARELLIRQCPHPLALAQHFDETVISTPAIEHISQVWVDVLHEWDGRAQISLGPQQGKSTMAQWAIFWALLENPDRRVVFASYSMTLARRSGRIIRGLVDAYGEKYGLRLDQSRHDASNWGLQGHRGGLIARGVEAGLTGEPCDLMVVDDLLAGQAEAQSKTIRDKVEDWWNYVARTRMAPGTPAVAIGTRWHHADILSKFIEEGWRRVNIPVYPDGKVEDSLDRPIGEWLISTRGHTAEDWQQVIEEVGPAAFGALYQGDPSPREGSIFKQDWFDASRIPAGSPMPQMASITVGVDPADTGTGDDAGVLVAGMTLSGELVILADLSGKLGEFEWARTACIALVVWNANRILQERQTGFRTSIEVAWALLLRQAVALIGFGSVEAASAELAARGDHVAAKPELLKEIVDIAEKIVDLASGPRVVSQTPRQSKIVRAESAAGMFQRGLARIYGHLPQVEFECVSLVENYKESPGRVDVLSMLTIHETANMGRSRVLV